MDSKFIKPSLFSADPNSSQAGKEWKHWYRTFTNFLESFPAEPAITDANKLRCLIAHIDKDVYDYVSECETYEEAVDILGRLYVKPCNVIFARHLLMTCKQQPEQSLDDYLQKLKLLAKDCNYRAVNADICRNEAIRDAFISGLQSTAIRSRLLENTSDESMTLQAIFNQARSLDIAHKSSERYNITSRSVLDVRNVTSVFRLRYLIKKILRSQWSHLRPAQFKESKRNVIIAVMICIQGFSVLPKEVNAISVEIMVTLQNNVVQKRNKQTL